MSLIQQKQRLNPIIWFLTGILLYAAWPMSVLQPIVFFALVPLLMVEDRVRNPYLFFAILWTNFLIWNVATTWWIWNASPSGAVGAIVANSLLMCAPWLLYRFAKRKLGQNVGLVALVAFWLSFEYLHHNWDLSWPWLTLGNIFSTRPSWVQWYKYTGTTGGSLWVLVVNVLLFNSIAITPRKNIQYSILNTQYSTIAAIFILPISLSLLSEMHFMRAPKDITKSYSNIVVVQPNIDAYTEKFTIDPAIQIAKLIGLAESKIDSNTRLVVWPETAIPVEVFEDNIMTNPYYQPIFSFVKKHPNILLVTGIDSYKNFGHINPGGFAARLNKGDGNYYEAYNTALGLDNSLKLQLYHKSKLVPGVESLPSWLGFMSKLFDDLGGTSGTLGKSKSAMVFRSPNNPYIPAPVICYESIYSDYVTDYSRLGANVITIITNDGWWGNTPGYHQHQNMARLRAIENGCWVARSANTGISCFISPQGDVYQPQPWDFEAAIKMDIPPTAAITFYAKHGDWISILAAALALILFVWAVVKRRKNHDL